MLGLSEAVPPIFHGDAEELVRSVVGVGVLLNGEAPDGLVGAADGRALDEERALGLVT